MAGGVGQRRRHSWQPPPSPRKVAQGAGVAVRSSWTGGRKTLGECSLPVAREGRGGLHPGGATGA